MYRLPYMKKGFDRSYLKEIALKAMIIDHIGAIMFPNLTFLRILGRPAFPIFAYMIAEGCLHTKNKKRYMWNILFFAFISQAVMIYFNDSDRLNVMFTFTLSTALVFTFQYTVEKLKQNVARKEKIYTVLLFVLSVGIVWAVNTVVELDYGFWGCVTPLIVTFGGYVDSDSITVNQKKTVFLALALALLYMEYGGVQIYAFISIIFLWFYNGEKGCRWPKYSFYIFYPAHIAVLHIIKIFI